MPAPSRTLRASRTHCSMFPSSLRHGITTETTIAGAATLTASSTSGGGLERVGFTGATSWRSGGAHLPTRRAHKSRAWAAGRVAAGAAAPGRRLCARPPPVTLDEERAVAGVDARGDARDPRPQRVVAGGRLEFGLEPVVRGQRAQRGAGEGPAVHLVLVVRPPVREAQRVADHHLVRYVAGHGLPAGDQRGDVVPAREV